jgi:hypothetical protein
MLAEMLAEVLNSEKSGEKSKKSNRDQVSGSENGGRGIKLRAWCSNVMHSGRRTIRSSIAARKAGRK